MMVLPKLVATAYNTAPINSISENDRDGNLLNMMSPPIPLSQSMYHDGARCWCEAVGISRKEGGQLMVTAFVLLQ